MLRPYILKIAEERGRESCPAADRATIGIASIRLRRSGVPPLGLVRPGGLVCLHEGDMTYDWAAPMTPL